MFYPLIKYSDEQKLSYLQAKQLLRKSSHKNVIKLLKHLEKNEQYGGNPFTERLFEFNVALILDRFLSPIGKRFAYEDESVGGVDFLFDDIALDVKSVGEKEFERIKRKASENSDKIENLELGHGIKILQMTMNDGGSWREYEGTMKIPLLENGLLADENKHLQLIKKYIKNSINQEISLKV